MAVRLAADIGGTFTDIVLQRGAERWTRKLLTTHAAPERAMLEGIAAALDEARLRPADVEVLLHGTTLATNALIERKGARTALVTTSGFRDILEMGYEKRYEHYDLDLELPAPLVPAELRFPVPERMDARGKVVQALDETAFVRLSSSLKEKDVEAVAIGFLHSYANPTHERRAGELLAKLLPGVPVTLSSEVCPEIREYERFSTAAANAYVLPLMATYLVNIEEKMRSLGFRCPLYLMTSGGGLTTVETARRFPVRLVESGPAGGAILSAGIARDTGHDEVLSFDMGGTTAKIYFISQGQPEQSRRFEVARVWRNLKGSGLPLRIPVTEMVEIGAGGGSIARTDALGRIAVGPQSGGSEPGPACYDRGGTEPTVTDADLVLGAIDPRGFPFALSAERGRRAIEEKIAERQHLTAEWAAAGICRMVEENMASAARVHAIERGRTPERCTMIAFGGAAPLHAAHLSRLLNIRKIIIPKDASVGSAIGFLRAPFAYELARSLLQRDDAFDPQAANRLIAEMAQAGQAIVAAGAPGAKIAVRASVEMRYLGQGHEIMVALPSLQLAAADAEALRAEYEKRYEAQYGVRVQDVPVEFLTWNVVATAEAPPWQEPDFHTVGRAGGRRRVFDPALGDWSEWIEMKRESLKASEWHTGPVLVTEAQTTTVVPTGWRVQAGRGGHLLLERTT
ncbi:MAG: hydantoinase/oxoprolinase family protein [Clostridia bacterium]